MWARAARAALLILIFIGFISAVAERNRMVQRRGVLSEVLQPIVRPSVSVESIDVLDSAIHKDAEIAVSNGLFLFRSNLIGKPPVFCCDPLWRNNAYSGFIQFLWNDEFGLVGIWKDDNFTPVNDVIGGGASSIFQGTKGPNISPQKIVLSPDISLRVVGYASVAHVYGIDEYVSPQLSCCRVPHMIDGLPQATRLQAANDNQAIGEEYKSNISGFGVTKKLPGPTLGLIFLIISCLGGIGFIFVADQELNSGKRWRPVINLLLAAALILNGCVVFAYLCMR